MLRVAQSHFVGMGSYILFIITRILRIVIGGTSL